MTTPNDTPISDTMEHAVAQLRAALAAVQRAAGIRTPRAHIAVSLHGAPAELALAWVECGGRIEVTAGAVTSSASQEDGDAAGDTLTIRAFLAPEERDRFVNALPVETLREAVMREQPPAVARALSVAPDEAVRLMARAA